MKSKNEISTFLIKSSSNRSFGTGFAIYKDTKGTFLLTAAHVVEACGKESLLVESQPAILLYGSDENDTIDLALIYVEGLFDSTPLKLSDEVAQEGNSFTVVGYRPHKHDYAKEPLKGAIKKAYTLESKEHKRDIYELTINDGATIEQGYSGSAVISTVTGLVLAIATDRKTNGRQAYATPSRYLREIWKELPEAIFESFNDNNPYKGLNSFEYKDRHNYYGREKESQEIVERLKKTKLFTLLGASGSGKSSLIYAGILPLIEEDGVKILSFRPLSEPFKNLASVFIPTLYPDKLEQIEQSEKLTRKLINSDIELDNLVQRFLEDTKAKHLYLIIDQFEELFTLTKEQEYRNQFFEQLLTLIYSELNVTLLISMRADFLSHISFYEPFNKAYNHHPSQMLSLLSHENLKRIIEEPAKKKGVTFQDGLVDRIIEEIEHEAGQLPLLEFALEQFWANKKGRIISHAVLDEMQSISHSISHYADKIYKSHPDYQASIEKVLIKLVNPGSGTVDTRRIASLDEFDKEARETITLLANERLVVTEDGNIDIIHEALIREWQRLQEWINKYRDFLVWEKRLRDDRKFYMDNGEKKEDLLRDSMLSNAEKFLKSHAKYIAPLDREFVKESIKNSNKKKRNKILLIASLFLFLLGVIVVVWNSRNDVKRSSEELSKIIKEFNVLSINIINTQDYKEVRKIFNYSINHYENTEDDGIKVVVSRAFLGRAILARKLKHNEEAIQYYDLLIDKYRNETNKEIEEIVAQSLYNKALLKGKMEAEELYIQIINRFEKSKNLDILKYVAKAYFNRAKNIKNSNLKIEILKNFISKMKNLKKEEIAYQIAQANVELSWLMLERGECHKALIYGEKSQKNSMDMNDSYINMAHTYLCLGNREEAMKIYRKYRGKMQGNQPFNRIILNDLEELRGRVIKIKDFETVKKLLEGG